MQKKGHQAGFRKRRNCLKCGKQFISKSRGNRICAKCNRANTKTATARDHPVRVGHYRRLED